MRLAEGTGRMPTHDRMLKMDAKRRMPCAVHTLPAPSPQR